MTDQIKARYNQLGAHNWLCPPKDYNFTLQGKYTSEISQAILLNVGKCNNSIDPSRPCVNQSIIDAMQANSGRFVLNFYFVNALINPGTSQYLDYYLNDFNYMQFTQTLGASAYGYITEFDITTDLSILPWSEDL